MRYKVISFLILFFTFILFLFSTAIVRADCQCSKWDCWPVTLYDDYENPIGFSQHCVCHDSIFDCDDSELSCPSGYYVCNQQYYEPKNCCLIGVVDPTPPPGGDGPYCGDGSCNGSEDCYNCPSDCNVCCGDGTCDALETCYNCVPDCGECSPGDNCGDGICGYGEACDLCIPDCGICPSCGDGVCSGFETCASCEEDCGVCPAYFAWWQSWGGLVGSEAKNGYGILSFIPGIDTCYQPFCIPSLIIRDRDNTTHSDGFPLSAGGEISAGSESITFRNPDVSVTNTSNTHVKENYSYFYSKYSLGFFPEDDFLYTYEDAEKPSLSKSAYFHTGSMTIQSPWHVASSESFVIFIDGNLMISDTDIVGELITVEEGGFLAFIVSGDINIDSSVGHNNLENTTGNIEGIFIADGTIRIQSSGSIDKRFIGEGTFVGWTSVDLERDYFGINNERYPTETFIYRPDFVKNTPEKMKRYQLIWQETN